MRRAALVIALVGMLIAPAAGFYEQSDLKTLFVLSEDVVFEEHEGVGSARLPAGASAAPSGPVMRGRELPSEVAPWLSDLGAGDRAILYVLHGPRGLDLTRFPVEELAALTNACECGSLIVVLDLPVARDAPALADYARGRQRIEAFGRHTIILSAKPWGARHWTPLPTGAGLLSRMGTGLDGAWFEEHEAGTSLFGAYLYAALLGFGDADFDGRVTAREAFTYAFWCTWVDCAPIGMERHTLPRRQFASARPGARWDEVVLSEGTYFGWPDPLSIAAAHYTTQHFVSPLGPAGAAGPAGPPGPDLIAGLWPIEGAEDVARWTWGSIAAAEQRLSELEARLADLALLAARPPMRVSTPRREAGHPVLLGYPMAESGPPGRPGPVGTNGLTESVTALLGQSATDEQMAAAQANERALLMLARTVREAEFEVEGLATVCLDYYMHEAVSISPQFIVPTEWPEALPAPYAVRGPMGPPGPAGGAGTVVEPTQVEPLWADATAQRLSELRIRADAAYERAAAATASFSQATDDWGGLAGER